MRQGRYSRADATYSDDKHSLREHLSLQLTAAPAGRNEALQLRQRSVPLGLAIPRTTPPPSQIDCLNRIRSAAFLGPRKIRLALIPGVNESTRVCAVDTVELGWPLSVVCSRKAILYRRRKIGGVAQEQNCCKNAA